MCCGFTYNGAKGSQYTTLNDIIKIPLIEAAPKNFRNFQFLKDNEDAIIEVYNDNGNTGGTYTSSVPINMDYQMEQ